MSAENRDWLETLARGVTAASRRANERIAEIERLVRQCDELARMDYDFLYDPARHLLAIGYNVDERRRDPGYYDLLASEARLSSFVAIAQGELPQENWFALGRLLTTAGGQPVLLSWSGSMFEYLMPLLVMPTYDEHAARPDLPGDRRPTDRVREAARRALGHFGVRLQLGRCQPQLSVSRLRRARSGAEARARGGSRRCPLRVGACADGGTRGVVPEPAASRRRRARRTLRPVRGYRLHPGAPAARTGERRRAFVHGAPPGHDPAFARSSAARASDAEALRSGPAVQGHPAVAAGAHPEDRRVLSASRRTVRDPRDCERPGSARAHSPQPRHADTGSAAVVERPLSRHGHERGRREQPLEGPRRHPLARRQHPRQLGDVLLHPRHGPAPTSGRPRISRRRRARRTTKRYSPKRAPNFAGATTISNRIPKSSFRRKTTSSCAGSASPIARARGARSRSPVTRKSCSRPLPPTPCIPRSPISSCRPRSSRSGKPSCARAGPARTTSRHPGCFT